MQQSKPTMKWDLLVLFAMALFGAYGLFIRLNPDINPLVFVWAFQAVGFTVFVIFYTLQGTKAPNAEARRDLIRLAVVAVLNDACLFAALKLTSVANAILAHQMEATIMVFIAPYFLKEKTTRREWTALGWSLIGVMVLYLGSSDQGNFTTAENVLGITLGLFSAVFLAFLIVFYRRLMDEDKHNLPLVAVNTWRYGLSLLALTPLMVFVPGFISIFTNPFVAGNIGVLVTFGICFAVIASSVHNIAMANTRGIRSATINNSESILAAFWAWGILGEFPGTYTLIGGAIILSSSLWLVLRKDNL